MKDGRMEGEVREEERCYVVGIFKMEGVTKMTSRSYKRKATDSVSEPLKGM